MLEENGRPQVVVLNDALFEKEPVPDGQIPMVCGMKVVYAPLQRHIHFFIKESFTNADRIRAMTDEELSYYLDGLAGDGCPPQMSPVCNKERYKCNVRKCWLEWLKQEAET